MRPRTAAVKMTAIIAGMDRVNETQILQYNGAFQKVVGLDRFPDQTALDILNMGYKL